jgi:hypothetical protein
VDRNAVLYIIWIANCRKGTSPKNSQYGFLPSWYSSVSEEYQDGENSYYEFCGLVPFLQLAIFVGLAELYDWESLLLLYTFSSPQVREWKIPWETSTWKTERDLMVEGDMKVHLRDVAVTEMNKISTGSYDLYFYHKITKSYLKSYICSCLPHVFSMRQDLEWWLYKFSY